MIIRTFILDLLDDDMQPISDIGITPKPNGSSGLFYLLPSFNLAPPGRVVIEWKITIVNPDIFRFANSMAIAKTLLADSSNVLPVPTTIVSIVDFTKNPNYPFFDLRCESREYKTSDLFYRKTFQFNTRYI